MRSQIFENGTATGAAQLQDVEDDDERAGDAAPIWMSCWSGSPTKWNMSARSAQEAAAPEHAEDELVEGDLHVGAE
jgi:hypothetical protein